MAEKWKQLKRSEEVIPPLRSIAMGVAIILWMMLTSAITWPIASAISGYSGGDLFATGTIVPAVIIAAVTAFVITRFVFPVTYTTTDRSPNVQEPGDE